MWVSRGLWQSKRELAFTLRFPIPRFATASITIFST
jgi:hypothetical protein